MSGSGPPRQEDKVNTFGVALVGVASAILVWATIVFLQAYYDESKGTLQEARDAVGKGDEVRSLRADQRAQLSQARYVTNTPAATVVTMPIDLAMAKVVADARTHQPSLVPAIGAHDKPTVPAVPGKPAVAAPTAAPTATPTPAATPTPTPTPAPAPNQKPTPKK